MKENKRQKIYKIIMLIIIVALVVFIVTSIINNDHSKKYVISSDNDSTLNEKLETAINSITKILNEKYLGEIDENALLEGALKGMVEAAGDVYTEYYTKKELDDFTTSTLGNFVGIGVYMQADMESNTVTVISPIAGSPAEKAGIKTGDKIIKVDGVEYKANQIDELATHVRGEEGTTVDLTILRGDKTLELTVTRESIHINYVTNQMMGDNIGYIAISTFDEGCAKDFLDAYNKLIDDGAKKLIIDLRNNGGGIVDEALDIADYICEKNDILLITADKDGKQEITKSKKNPKVTIPVVVLTNRGSASASEILVAGLKDNNKAEIVGEKTFGKGVIQELIYLSNGGALKVTSEEYYTPNGNKINNVGIEPDYQISGVTEQLERAIEVLKSK